MWPFFTRRPYSGKSSHLITSHISSQATSAHFHKTAILQISSQDSPSGHSAQNTVFMLHIRSSLSLLSTCNLTFCSNYTLCPFLPFMSASKTVSTCMFVIHNCTYSLPKDAAVTTRTASTTHTHHSHIFVLTSTHLHLHAQLHASHYGLHSLLPPLGAACGQYMLC